MALTLPSAIPADARVSRDLTTNLRDALVVSYRADDRTRIRLYFDNSTGALVRRVVLKETPIGVIPQQTDFEEWRNLGDTRFPYTIKTSLVDPWVGSTRRYVEVRLDAKIDESVFAVPK